MHDLNVRRSFDGLKFVVRTKDWRIDLFGMKPDLSPDKSASRRLELINLFTRSPFRDNFLFADSSGIDVRLDGHGPIVAHFAGPLLFHMPPRYPNNCPAAVDANTITSTGV